MVFQEISHGRGVGIAQIKHTFQNCVAIAVCTVLFDIFVKLVDWMAVSRDGGHLGAGEVHGQQYFCGNDCSASTGLCQVKIICKYWSWIPRVYHG